MFAGVMILKLITLMEYPKNLYEKLYTYMHEHDKDTIYKMIFADGSVINAKYDTDYGRSLAWRCKGNLSQKPRGVVAARGFFICLMLYYTYAYIRLDWKKESCKSSS